MLRRENGIRRNPQLNSRKVEKEWMKNIYKQGEQVENRNEYSEY